jgi:beta-lactamase class D
MKAVRSSARVVNVLWGSALFARTLAWRVFVLVVLIGCAHAPRPSSSDAITAKPSASQAAIAVSASSVTPEREEVRAIANALGEGPSTFVAFDEPAQRWIRHDPERASEGFLPASTFKLPNALIALDLGIVSGVEFELDYDAKKDPGMAWWPASWRQDHTLRTALANSVVWYFQEVARRAGKQRLTEYLLRFGYGNASTEGNVDSFWLDGGLRISANQQIAFLRRLYHGTLPVSRAAMDTLKSIMVLEERAGVRVSGKTGTVTTASGKDLVWLVGYVERGSAVCFFAWNREGEYWDSKRRVELTLQVLVDWRASSASTATKPGSIQSPAGDDIVLH